MSQLQELRDQMRQLEKSQKLAKAELKASQKSFAYLVVRVEARALRKNEIVPSILSSLRKIKRAEDRIRSNKTIMRTLRLEIDRIRFARALEAVAI